MVPNEHRGRLVGNPDITLLLAGLLRFGFAMRASLFIFGQGLADLDRIA